MRNSGSVMGGAINFSNNHSKANAGGIALSTYLIFVAFGVSNCYRRWCCDLTVQTQNAQVHSGLFYLQQRDESAARMAPKSL